MSAPLRARYQGTTSQASTLIRLGWSAAFFGITTSSTPFLPVAEMLLAVSFGCSCAFVVPFAHQCNLMVQGPGGYSTRDFVRVGGGLSVVVALVAVGMLSWMAG